MTELRFALRRLLVHPGFLAATTATLSLGIGATALMFSAVFGLLIRPLPFPDADRLAWMMARPAEQAGALEAVSSDEVRAIAGLPALDRVAVIGDMGLVREVGSRHDRWRGIWATRGLAEVLGVQLVAGRIPDRIDPEGPKVMLIASGRWQRDFAADPRAVGRVMEFADNKRFILAGVLPDGLEFPFARAPHRGNGAGFVAGVQDFWVLQSDAPAHLPGGVALARIRPNLTAAAAAAQVATQEWCSSKVC